MRIVDDAYDVISTEAGDARGLGFHPPVHQVEVMRVHVEERSAAVARVLDPIVNFL